MALAPPFFAVYGGAVADKVEFEMMQWVRTLPQERRSDPQMTYLQMRKDPGTALGLGCLCFLGVSGIGRLYIGDVGLGLAMLFLNVFTCGVWSIVDLFLIGAATDRKNRAILARLRMTLEG